MKLKEKIRFLMVKNDIKTLKELSKKSDIPYTTLRSIDSSKGSNIRIETASALAKFFKVSIDFLSGITSIENPKLFLEEVLSTYNIHENEYNLVMNEIINNQTINFSFFDFTDKEMTKVQKIYNEIFYVYMNYLGTSPLEYDTDDLNVMKKHNKEVDAKFIEMLKSLDKNKIIKQYHSNTIVFKESNAFPTIDKPIKIPVIGKISAGLPLLATENIEEYIFAPSSSLNEDYEYFYLIVNGDSMNRRFQNGDKVLVQKQSTLENGDIGVVLIDGNDATVKRFKSNNGLIVLEPMSTNPEHEVQIYDPQKIRVEIIGKVILCISKV